MFEMKMFIHFSVRVPSFVKLEIDFIYIKANKVYILSGNFINSGLISDSILNFGEKENLEITFKRIFKWSLLRLRWG